MSEKRLRTAAKALLTKAITKLIENITNNEPMDIVSIVYNDVEKRWNTLIDRHETYLSSLQADADAADEWLNEVEDNFSDAQLKYTKYKRLMSEKSCKKGLEIKEIELCQSIDLINQMISKGSPVNAVLQQKVDLDSIFKSLKETHSNLIETSMNMDIGDQFKKMSIGVNQVNISIGEYMNAVEVKKDSSSRVRMEQLPMPKFNGNIREYPRFRKEFTDLVMPNLSEGEAAFSLRKCLNNEVEMYLGACDEKVSEMLSRLDERYGDPRKVIDAVISEIIQYRKIREADKDAFIKFIDIIERAYRDLSKLKLEDELRSVNIISLIESKLPDSISMQWYRNIYQKRIDRSDTFIPLLNFLKTERSAFEYSMSKTKTSYSTSKQHDSFNKSPNNIYEKDSSDIPTRKKCWLHQSDGHSIEECYTYKSKSNEEKLTLVKDNNVCWRCLQPGHRSNKCQAKMCGKDGCQISHHESLHEAHTAGLNFHMNYKTTVHPCILLVMSIPIFKSDIKVNAMWDTASTVSLITMQKAKELSLSGERTHLTIIKAGGESEDINSFRYNLNLVDKDGNVLTIVVYGIPKISSTLEALEINKIVQLFEGVQAEDIQRPSGEIDILIGIDFASFHPRMIQNSDQLVLYESRFGYCIGGSHPMVKDDTQLVISQALVNHIRTADKIIDQFFEVESLGTACKPKCGSCRCGKCPLGGKDFTLKEEREMKLIEDGLKLKDSCWEAKYPWLRDSNELPDNRNAAVASLLATEKRLMKSPDTVNLYCDQMQEMIDRNAARKLTKTEMDQYNGPVHYIMHHEVVKTGYTTTPLRIVFDASRNYHGHILNLYWAKGPDLINNMLGILLRFREDRVCFVGDIRKMYHSVRITLEDQHVHRFLWRNMNLNAPIETWVMNCVSFGDKPAGSIAQLALRKTADMKKDQYPGACKVIYQNTYVDDMLGSVANRADAIKLTNEIDQVLESGGFKIKSWTISNDDIDNDVNRKSVFFDNKYGLLDKGTNLGNDEVNDHKVLGVKWNSVNDQIYFSVQLNFCQKKRKVQRNNAYESDPSLVPSFLTKRMVLSQINGFFDPLGLAAPFTIKAKMLMRRLWIGNMKNLDWDDDIPEEERILWVKFFEELKGMKDVKFSRCLKPKNASPEDPDLVMFSDASENAYGACGYVVWKLSDGNVKCELIAAKNRITPTKDMSIVRKELEAAVLSKRLQEFICKEMSYNFRSVHFLIDSEIVLSMLNKESYGFQTYAALRIGEIQQATKLSQWFWVEGTLNIADWITRGRKPNEISAGSIWQVGPEFMYLPFNEWPIRQTTNVLNIPEQIRTVMLISNVKHMDVKPNEKVGVIMSNEISSVLDINRFSKYLTLLGTTARVLSVFNTKPPSFLNVKQGISTEQYEDAKMVWVRDAQSNFSQKDMENKYVRLCPRRLENGVWIVSGRSERWMEISYNQENVILLPFHHIFSRLYAEYVHSLSHRAVMASVVKVRLRFWIINLPKMMKYIVSHCVPCRKKMKCLAGQIMSPLPIERLKPAPPWYAVALDYCGPFTIRGEVNKRARGKCYMVLFNCLICRAVYVDIAASYDANDFLKVLRRFFTIRGKPSLIYADNGSQIKAASKEMADVMKGIDWEVVSSYGAEEGIGWRFTAPDSPWQNGCSESLIKSLKCSLIHSIGDHILSFSEIQTVAFEAANMLNERPIGRHPTSPEEGQYLCPNDLMLGRATSRVPQGPFKEHVSDKHRFRLVQLIASGFWRKMIKSYFPSLIIRQKWHHSRRNMAIGDIVLIQDINALRGH